MSKKRKEILKNITIETIPANEVKYNCTKINGGLVEILDSKSFHLYCYLLSQANRSGLSNVTYDEIHNALSFNRTTISNCIKKLKKYGLIYVHKIKAGDYHRNMYEMYTYQETER